MKTGFLPVFPLRLSLVLAWLALPALALATQPEMTVEELLNKVAERAKKERSKPPQREFIRTKITLEFDKKHKVKTREELTYRMVILDGVLYPRLIRKNGQALTPEEQANEEKKEAAFRNGQEKNAKSEQGNTVLMKLDEGTAKRFDFAITGREEVNGRGAYVVTVAPKAGLPAKTTQEQVMGHISGRLWIDENEYEIAKLEVRLTKSVHFGVVGLLGALHAFDFSVYRNRRLEGDWENSLVKIRLQFRVFLNTRRFQYEERISALPPETQAADACPR